MDRAEGAGARGGSSVTGKIDIGTADTWIGVDCGGDTPLPSSNRQLTKQDKWHIPA